MKVHNKGQVVIPAAIRAQLGIEIGDVLEVEVVPEEGRLELRRSQQSKSVELGGSLQGYARGKKFPTRKTMADALRRGLLGDG